LKFGNVRKCAERPNEILTSLLLFSPAWRDIRCNQICTRRVSYTTTERELTIRILIADDYADWRRQVHLLLRTRPEWQVISEASDGLEAVQKAHLMPDLILLDIGLPKLNGIEVAGQIRQLSPSSKIILLSQNSDLDIVRAALGTGALGYVRKTDARRELLPAMDAVLRGEQFISSSNGFKYTAV
jgi:DNA-binding NarL/FixJ family response regulator